MYIYLYKNNMYITYLSTYLSIDLSIYIYIDGLKLRMSRSFPFFYPEDRNWPISGRFGSNLESLVMIFLYFGTVVLSFSPSTPKLVNFPHFLDSRSWERNMSTPKLVNFPHFLDSRSWEKKHVNTKTSQFSPFFGLQELRKKYVNTKTSQFS